MPTLRHSAIAAASVALLLSLGGCGQRTDSATTTVGEKVDAAVERGTEVARSAGQEAREGIDAAKDRAAAATEATRDAATAPDGGTNVMGAAREARDQAYSTNGAGSTGTAGKVDDSRITSMVQRGLKADKELDTLRIDVDSRDGVVTLSGSVPSAAARARAGEIARNVKDVRSVNDQLTLNAG